MTGPGTFLLAISTIATGTLLVYRAHRRHSISWVYGVVIFLGALSSLSDQVVGFSIPVVAAIGLAISEMLRLVRQPQRGPLFMRLDLISVALVLLVGLATIVQSSRIDGLIGMLTIAALLTVGRARKEFDLDDFRDLALALGLAGLTVTAGILIQATLYPNIFGPLVPTTPLRYAAWFDNPNAAAFYMTLAFAGLVWMALENSVASKVVFSAAGVALIWGILLTQSRSGLISAVAAAFLGVWLRFRSRAVKVLTALAAVVVLAAIFLGSADLSLGPSARPFALGADREDTWAAGIDAIEMNPWFGVRTNEAAYDNLHSDFLQIAVEHGLLAFIAFVLLLGEMVVVFVRPMWKPTPGPAAHAYLGAMVLMAGAAFSAGGHTVLQGGVTFWLFLGTVYGSVARPMTEPAPSAPRTSPGSRVETNRHALASGRRRSTRRAH